MTSLSRSSYLTLGGDPGQDGAIVLLEHPSNLLICVWPFRDFAFRQAATGLRPFAPRIHFAAIEKNSARPASKTGEKGQGVASAFTFGHACGELLGLCIGLGLDTVEVRPSVWKAILGLTADKREVCAQAALLFPRHAELFFGPKGGLRDGIAEAAFLALYARRFVKSEAQRLTS